MNRGTISFMMDKGNYADFKRIAELMSTQDNLCTSYPIYCVYQKVERIVDPNFDSCDVSYRIHQDDHCTYKDNEIEAALKEYNEENDENLTIKDCEEFYLKEFDEPVPNQVYLTKVDAENHIKNKKHHYRKPFVYVNSAHDNWFLRMLIDTIWTEFNESTVPYPHR